MGMVRNFLEFNSTLSRLGTIKNMSEYGTHVEYLRLAAILFSVPDVNRVVDIAAGSSWQFPITYKEVYGLELTGVDIDADALKLNNTLDFRFVNDVCAVIAQFPSSLAPFALINRALPHRLKKRLLNSLFPSEEIGYRAFYDKCRYTSFRAAAERSGFQIEYYLPSYMSSDYFSWLLPLFCLSQLLDIVRLVFSPNDLASYNLFVLRRPGKHFAIKWSWHS